MKQRLFWKILLAFWLTFLAITQGVWLVFELSRDRRTPPERLMAEQVAPVALAAVAEAVSRDGPQGFERLAGRLSGDQRERLALAPASDPPQGKPGNAGRERFVTRVATAPDGRAYRLSYRYRQENGPIIPLNTPPQLLVMGLAGGLLFSLLLAWYLIRPINRLRTGFERLAQGDLGVRVGPAIGARRDEIADLGRDFDQMAQRVEQLVAARDRLLHDVSHELRSPLARMQLAIGLAGKSSDRSGLTLDRIAREAQRLDELVGELLTLARAEHGQTATDDYFDLTGVLASVADDARFEAQASDVEIRLVEDIPAEERRPLLSGDAELLRRALDNIMRNALRFSPAGEAIDARIAYLAAERAYRIEISDGGPGVPEKDMPALFDPFVRGEQGGPGFGLGLAIASRAIAAHGGTICASNRAEGGFTVTVSLPVHPDTICFPT